MIATITLALAIVAEVTLSFLGVGASDRPSLRNIYQDWSGLSLFSGEWWILAFPAFHACLSVNLLGDWLKDTLNPRAEVNQILDVQDLSVEFPQRRQNLQALDFPFT